MQIWTIEIEGRPTLAFATDGLDDEENRDLAENTLQEGWLQEDLMALNDIDANPLWDGESRLELRLANEEEQAAWRSSLERAKEDGDADRDADWLFFLLPVNDSSDEV